MCLIFAAVDAHPEDLCHLLLDRTIAPDKLLPDTGVGPDAERMLSPIFISSPRYGTRSTTVILLDRTGMVTFLEKSFLNDSDDPSAVEYTFMMRK